MSCEFDVQGSKSRRLAQGASNIIPFKRTMYRNRTHIAFPALYEQLDRMFHRYLQSTESSQQPLIDALKFYGSIFCVGFVVYCYVRKRFPRTYAVRQWVPEIRTPAADDQFGYISWLWKVYSFSADELQEIIGLDALCFLRLLNMGFRLACVGAFNSIWLLPVYGTAEKSPDAPEHDAVVNEVSFNDLQDGSPRFVATVIAAYVFFGFTMYTIQKECIWLITQRETWMRRFKQRNYSVLVRNIPNELRSDSHLLAHFQRLFGARRGECMCLTELTCCNFVIDVVSNVRCFLP